MLKILKLFDNTTASRFHILGIFSLAIVIFSIGVGIGWKAPFFGSVSIPRTNGIVFDESQAIEGFALIDDNGESFGIERLQGTWSVIYFGYTHCPDICPTALSVLAKFNALRSQEADVPLQYIFVSIDPERDTLPLLRAYTEFFFSDLIGVTGSIEELTDFGSQLSVSFESSSSTGEDYSVSHSDVVVLTNPRGFLQAIFTPPHSADKLLADFDAIREWYVIAD